MPAVSSKASVVKLNRRAGSHGSQRKRSASCGLFRERDAEQQSPQSGSKKIPRSPRGDRCMGCLSTMASRIKKSGQKRSRSSTSSSMKNASEYELTDKGIRLWGGDRAMTVDDFRDAGSRARICQDRPQTEHLDERGRQNPEKSRFFVKQTPSGKNGRTTYDSSSALSFSWKKTSTTSSLKSKIVIIDENTGRPQPGRRFSDGLHQSIEAKEGVAIQGETQTYATITLQNYFRLHSKNGRHDRNGDDGGQ
jgi:hypothetical protein